MTALTEEDAKLRWCPLAARIQGSADTRCIASACMAWRPVTVERGKKVEKGYCGAFGRPD